MGHAGAAQRLDERLFDDALFDVQGQFAGALLRRAPADAVRQTGDVFNFFGMNPCTLFGDGRGTVMGTSFHAHHLGHFIGILHVSSSLHEVKLHSKRKLLRRFFDYST